MSDRYSRQIALPEVGAEGQAQLARTAVLIVGVGGLGSVVAQSLCAAGVGHLTVIDHDRVEESNLHRQPLYRMRDIGALKAKAARDALLEANPRADVDAICDALTPVNATVLIAAADIVVDAADSFAVSYVLSDECLRAGKTLISASVLGLSGYVGAFCRDAPSYRAVFPEMPQQLGTCAQDGVLGTAVGVIGALQAQMTLATILNLQPSVAGQLVSVDFHGLRIGGFRFLGTPEPAAASQLRFIAPLEVNASDVVVDLRTSVESSEKPFSSTLRATVDTIADLQSELPSSRRLVLCCRSGVRAWRAARVLQKHGYKDLALIALG
jgi:molybdopterin/thiamine biosynthesis adenylyltransferase/rhodanese-related sulfurtransferase